ncbi:DNA starvation/stationary phase protection protein [Weissella kandleri]|uniref:DNA starvation/stationary phase protection protein n=1 Tax=Weissella kandleri TaxID=1616 RepID=UPI00387ED084
MTLDEQYQKELKQSELDHHTPTAAAMTSHILANLELLKQKARQFRYYQSDVTVQAVMTGLETSFTIQFEQVSQALLALSAIVPTTFAEFEEYGMLELNGRDKYLNASEQLDMIKDDLKTANLFIERGIELAKRESLFNLQMLLTYLLKFNQQFIE